MILILKTVLDIALGAIVVWCVFTVCDIKDTLRGRELQIDKMSSRLTGVEIIQSHLVKHIKEMKERGGGD